MYEKGDLIFYGNAGVYRVEEIGPIRHIRGYDPEKNYYKLSSLCRGDVTYVPVDTGVFMRPVIGRREAEELLARASDLEENICDSRDPRVLREHYQKELEAHTCEELFRLIKSVDAKGRQAARAGKRLGKTDQEYKKRAEHLLSEELSAALELPLESIQLRLCQALR